MTKFNDALVAALQNYFETGDKPTEAQYAEWIQAIQDGIEEHTHVSTGGAETGTGDASAVINLQSGLDASKSATPAVGDVYLATDTDKTYVCFTAEEWSDKAYANNLQSGLDASKSATPAVGDVYIATDAAIMYVCYTANNWTAVGGGNGGSQKFVKCFVPTDGVYFDVMCPELVQVDEMFFSWMQAEFADGQDHFLYFFFALPACYSQGNIKITVFWISDATEGDVEWFLGLTYRSQGDPWYGNLGDSEVVLTTTNAVAGKINHSIATITDHGADLDMCVLHVYRNGGGGSDTMEDTANLIGVLLEEQ